MKQLLFTLAFVSVSVVSFAQLDMAKPDEKKPSKSNKTIKPFKPKPVNTASYIIIYRDGQFAAALINYSIFIDGRKICALSNGRYLKYPVSAGKHEIEATKSGITLSKKETYTSVMSSPGRNNYVAVNIKKTLLKEKVEMNEVGEGTGRRNINDLKEDNCQEDINDSKRRH